MPLSDIRDVGRIGLVTDQPAHELPPNAWDSAVNVSFRGSKVELSKGWQQVFGTPTVVPYYIGEAPGTTNLYWVYTNMVKVYAALSTAHTDITGLNDFSGGIDNKFQFVWLNGVMVINNGVDTPQFWASIDTGVSLADLTNWPANTTAKVIRQFKNFLIALDVTKTSARYPTLVKWSHPADPGSVPASWDETDATYLAGEQPLSETPGFLVDGMALRDQFVIYKSDSIVLMQFVSGQSVFRFITVETNVGLLAANCVCQVGRGLHAFISAEGEPYLFDGQKVIPIGEEVIADSFQSDALQEYRNRSYVVFDAQTREVLFCLAGENEYPETAYVFDLRYKTWTTRDIPQSVSAANGIFSPETEPTWDSDTETWVDDDTVWNSGRAGALNAKNLVAAGFNDNKLFQLNTTERQDTADFTASLVRTGLAVYGNDQHGRARVDFTKVKLITEIWPLIEASSGQTVDITIGSQDTRDSAVSWGATVTFDPSTEDFIPVMLDTRYMAIKFEINSTTNSELKLHGYQVNTELVGRYF